MNDPIITKNALIKSVSLDIDDHGCLSGWLHLDYGGSCQSFGGWALYLPPGFTHWKLQSLAGHWIFRVLKIADVKRWQDLPGKSIRVRASLSQIYSVGHILHNDWFTPSDDFAL